MLYREKKMEYTKESIFAAIQEIVMEVCGVKILSENDNLLDRRFGIRPADFLYIFDMIEQRIGIPAVNVLKDTPYTIMEAGNLSEALLALKQQG